MGIVRPRLQAQPESLSEAAAAPVAAAPPALELLVAAAGVDCAEFDCAEFDCAEFDCAETVELIVLDVAGPSLVASVVA